MKGADPPPRSLPLSAGTGAGAAGAATGFSETTRDAGRRVERRRRRRRRPPREASRRRRPPRRWARPRQNPRRRPRPSTRARGGAASSSRSSRRRRRRLHNSGRLVDIIRPTLRGEPAAAPTGRRDKARAAAAAGRGSRSVAFSTFFVKSDNVGGAVSQKGHGHGIDPSSASAAMRST